MVKCQFLQLHNSALTYEVKFTIHINNILKNAKVNHYKIPSHPFAR